jgi:hypothetical protein
VQGVNEAVEVNLLAKTGKLHIECTVQYPVVPTATEPISTVEEAEAGEAIPVEMPEPVAIQTARFRAELPISDFPEDSELRTDVVAERVVDDGYMEGDARIVFRLKASMDDTSKLVASKELELDQLIDEFNEIVEQVQDAKKAQAQASKASKEKTSKKGAKVGGGKKGSKGSSGSRSGGASKADGSGSDEAVEVAGEGGLAATAASYADRAMRSVLTAGAFAVENRAYALFVVAAAAIHFYGDYASV